MLNAHTVSSGALMITSCLERNGGLMCFSQNSFHTGAPSRTAMVRQRAAFLTRTYGIDRTCSIKPGSRKADTRLTHFGRKAGKSHQVTIWFWIATGSTSVDSEREPPVGAQHSEDAAG